MKMIARASVDIPRPPEAVFDAAVDPARLPDLLRKRGPIPGVTSVEMEAGSTLGPGSRRSVKMSDGSTMREEITALERPRSYRYRWLNRPAAPFSWLVRGADADWSFRASGTGTIVDWVYTLELTSPLAYPVAAPVVWMFRGWMQAALDRLRG